MHPQSVHNIVHMVLMIRAFNVNRYILCLYAISFFPLTLFRKYAAFVDVTWLTVHGLSECQFRAPSHKQALPKSVGSTNQ